MTAAADPILASALWASERKHERNGPWEAGRSKNSLEIGVGSIGNALNGVLRYGEVCCISAQPGSGERELYQAVLVEYLLSSPVASATILDIGSSFDVRNVYRAALARLKDGHDAPQKALRALDRLNIIKVFDFEGLTDAVFETRLALQNRTSSLTGGENQGPAPRPTIGDSDEDEDMLDLSSPPARPANTNVQDAEQMNLHTYGLLLIDSLSNVVAPLVKNNHARGQGLLISFMRSLSHLSQTFNLCTIVVSGTVSFANSKEEAPSAFASCALRPMLGKAFSHVLDTHLLVHQTPQQNSSGGKKRDEAPSVVEVLHDRNGNRLGRWIPFVVDKAGELHEYP